MIFVQKPKQMKHRLVANRWRTPDGTLLWSRYTHDFVSHIDENGETYIVDGGNDYCRISQNKEPMSDECVYADDDFEKVRKIVMRGTFDKNGDRLWLPIKAMSDAHLCNCIIDGLKHMQSFDSYDLNMHLYVNELIYRHKNRFCIKDHEYVKDEVDHIKTDDIVLILHRNIYPSLVEETIKVFSDFVYEDNPMNRHLMICAAYELDRIFESMESE